jgi:outer membrane protein OmpA-like peptidoglycan-associated protein
MPGLVLSRARHALALGALAAPLAFAAPAAAQDTYASADDPAAHRAAVRALPGRHLAIVARTLPIVGISTGIEAVLEDLNAKVTQQEIVIDLAADVLFDFDKADLRPEAAGEIGKVAQVLASHPGAPVTIEGHTDAKGDDAYNQRLSERRAASVKAWLVTNGADAATITTRGRGETEPVAPNAKPDGSDDPEGRQRNRRVEITLRTGG